MQDQQLLYIAEWALNAPLPPGWTVHLDEQGNEFFFNAETRASTYEHPLDQHYRTYYQEVKDAEALEGISEEALDQVQHA